MPAEIPKPKSVEEAITMALAYETRVRDTYKNAVDQSGDETARRVFGLLAKEEQGHIDYLESRLAEWRKDGVVVPEKLETMIPPQEVIEKNAAELQKRLEPKDRGEEVKMLQKAEEVERETSDFYASMVDAMQDEAKEMFARFLEIEEGHLAIVRAEIDALSGTGYFFEWGEFNMEA